MDAVLLARIQFGFTAGFHFLFPPVTLGLALVILVLESLYLAKKDEAYRTASAFLVRIFSVVFVMGVATGIVLEFAFGNNWARYSRTVGDIFGAPLAAEGIFSFFLESVFLGVLVFGRNRVSPRTYRLSAFLVFLGSHLSGLWIIIANSWMQTPAGYRLEGGKAMLSDFFAAAFNPSTWVRYFHTILAGWITGSLVAVGIAAWLLIKGRHARTAEIIMKPALLIFVVTSCLQLLSGHGHSVQVARTQPEKMAAFEALWTTQTRAPLYLFGIPDPSAQKTRFPIAVPGMLSVLIHGDAGAEVAGLDKFPDDERPPVVVPFVSYHLMILMGMAFIALGLAGVFLWARGKIWNARWFLRILVFSVPVPLLANEFGWIAAEVGRQPWAVYRVLRTADASSVSVPAGNILATLALFLLVYALIAAAGLKAVISLIRKGPEGGSPEAERT
jgi:cytochrome bd ubiquinol oxidase subunit I